MTTINSNSPFVPGAIVARISENWNRKRYDRDTVLKVRANGNFTLASDPTQQYSPSLSGWGEERRWHAIETGRGYHKASVQVWDAEIDARIAEGNAKRLHERRVYEIRHIPEPPAGGLRRRQRLVRGPRDWRVESVLKL